jgi:gag-polypeptide of LTR copia-type
MGSLTPNARWDRHEASVKRLVAVSIPDSAFNHVKSGLSAKEVWKKLKRLYEGRTEMMMTDLNQRLRTTKCGEVDNVCTHIQMLADLREQLASMGKSITDLRARVHLVWIAPAVLRSCPPQLVCRCPSDQDKRHT